MQSGEGFQMRAEKRGDERPFSLVSGWHAGSVPPTNAAIKQGLAFRSAVVLESHRPSCAEMVCDHGLLSAALRSAGSLVAHDRVTFWIDRPTVLQRLLRRRPAQERVAGVSSLENFLHVCPSFDAPDQVVYEVDFQHVMHCVYEPWNLLGGPWPYHDSYTFSFLATEEHARALMGTFAEALVAAGGTLLQVFDASANWKKPSPEPVPPPAGKALG